jgi:hypothetical protein
VFVLLLTPELRPAHALLPFETGGDTAERDGDIEKRDWNERDEKQEE